MENFNVISSVRKIYSEMLKDIREAKNYIYLETYIYGNDKIGRAFRRALIKKAEEGVSVKILIDAWGSRVDKYFFKKLVKNGGEVRFFREFRYVLRILSKNHERNHRKLLLIDDKISYIGSVNIVEECLDWRELVIRINGNITPIFTKTFLKNWNETGKITKKRVNAIAHEGFEILRDVPSEIHKLTSKRYIRLIKKAKKEILIETPYFIPTRKIRKAFASAVKRGVKIRIIIPKSSDVNAINLLRNRYLGVIYRAGVDIYYYKRSNLHSKLLIIDDKYFLLGSSNLDYRSFIHQYEINLLGEDAEIIKALKNHFCETLKFSELFNYMEWKSRSSIDKILELFLHFVRRYL
ncbi:MAG: phosphatidylserine/phosphatidylglycerophosphate/cardiolipin synthase family protein [Candidatus Pacearchaeota archaeon]